MRQGPPVTKSTTQVAYGSSKPGFPFGFQASHTLQRTAAIVTNCRSVSPETLLVPRKVGGTPSLRFPGLCELIAA